MSKKDIELHRRDRLFEPDVGKSVVEMLTLAIEPTEGECSVRVDSLRAVDVNDGVKVLFAPFRQVAVPACVLVDKQVSDDVGSQLFRGTARVPLAKCERDHED